MDKIFIRELALRCIIGIYPEERREKQDIVINAGVVAFDVGAKNERIPTSGTGHLSHGRFQAAEPG